MHKMEFPEEIKISKQIPGGNAPARYLYFSYRFSSLSLDTFLYITAAIALPPISIRILHKNSLPLSPVCGVVPAGIIVSSTVISLARASSLKYLSHASQCQYVMLPS